MPSFDIPSEVDQPALRNAVEQANRRSTPSRLQGHERQDRARRSC